MKNKKLLLLIFLVINSAGFINGAAVSTAQGTDSLITIKLINASPWPLTAKLVGVTSKAVKLNPSGIHRFRALPGDYYLFYQFYNAEEKKYSYLRTELFAVKAGSDQIVATADSGPTYMYEEGYYKRVWLLESDFHKPPGWPAGGVPIENYPGFNSLKLIVAIEDLYLDDRDYERTYVTGVVKGMLNRIVARDILPQLRRQGFRVTYAGVSNLKVLPETFTEPTLGITYVESEGREFFAMKGIFIQCRLALYGAGSKQSEPLWEQEVTGTNGDKVKLNILNANGSFRNDSLADLKSNFSEFVIDLSDWKVGR